jgi:hypothetical protein
MAGTNFHLQTSSFHTAGTVFTQQEQFSRALTGFVSCVGNILLAKTQVVCNITVIQNGPSTHIINATSFVKKCY